MRVDFNVPLVRGRISDDARIRETLPTIQAVRNQRGSRLVLMSHLGRPGGVPNKSLIMAPIAQRLEELLRVQVHIANDCVGASVEEKAEKLVPGEVLMLENVRFHQGEETNNERFASQLAKLGQVYVNDAFGTAHRAHASTVGVPSCLPPDAMAAGLLMQRELKELNSLLHSPVAPFVLVIGGSKVSSKIRVLRNLLDRVDSILIGGGMAYTFLAAQGVSIGTSFVEEDLIHEAANLLDTAAARRIPVILPTDHVAVTTPIEEVSIAGDVVAIADRDIPLGLTGVDIGPRTSHVFRERISSAGTVFWNGPMGIAEIKRFQRGTLTVAGAVVESSAYAVVGGGDSVAALKDLGIVRGVDHVSTGGGASLELLEGRVLPGVEVLVGRD